MNDLLGGWVILAPHDTANVDTVARPLRPVDVLLVLTIAWFAVACARDWLGLVKSAPVEPRADEAGRRGLPLSSCRVPSRPYIQTT